MRLTGRLVLALSASLLSSAAPAQSADPVEETAAIQAAIGQTIMTYYGTVSGNVGEKRNWDRLRTLFVPDARITTIGPSALSSRSLAEFIANSGPVFEDLGITETELARRTEVYEKLASVWSSYGKRSKNPALYIRGIRSMQLNRQPDGRWLIVSIVDQPELDVSAPIPTDMEGQ